MADDSARDQEPRGGPESPAFRLGLEALWDDVVHARACVAAERHDPQHHVGPTARIALVCALEAYLGGIKDRGYPAPHPLVNELNLQRLATTRHPGASGQLR